MHGKPAISLKRMLDQHIARLEEYETLRQLYLGVGADLITVELRAHAIKLHSQLKMDGARSWKDHETTTKNHS